MCRPVSYTHLTLPTERSRGLGDVYKRQDKSGIMFKVSVHNEAGMKEFVAGNNPKAKAIYAECVDNIQLWELSKVEVK